MALGYCFWFNNISELTSLHGDDIFGHGAQVSFSEGDMIFVQDELEEDIDIYSCVGYQANTSEQPPFKIIGPYSEVKGEYSVWRLVNLAYSMTAVSFAKESSINPASSSNAVRVASHFDRIKYNNIRPVYQAIRRLQEAAGSSSGSLQLNDTTELLWDEEPGAQLLWEPTYVGLDGAESGGGGGTDMEFQSINSFPSHVTQNSAYPVLGEFFIKVTLSATTGSAIYFIVTTYKWNGSAIVSVSTANSSTFERTLTFAVSMTRATLGLSDGGDFFCGEWAAEGSKPQQGIVAQFSINTSTGVVSFVRMINPPVPGRYGKFGRATGIIEADLGSGAAPYMVTGDEASEEMYVYDMSGVRQRTLALPKDHYLLCVYPSETSETVGYFLALINENGTLKVNLVKLTSTEFSYIWLGSGSDSYDYYGLWIVKTTASYVYYIWENYQDVYLRRVDRDTCLNLVTIDSFDKVTLYPGTWQNANMGYKPYDNRLTVLVYNQTTDEEAVYVLDIDYLTGFTEKYAAVTEALASQVNRGNRPIPLLQADHGGEDVVVCVWKTGWWIEYWQPTGGSPVFEYFTGHYYINGNVSQSRIAITESMSHINSASHVSYRPTDTEIYFAYSVDDGVSWKSHDGTSVVNLTSLADIKVNGEPIDHLSAALDNIDLTGISEIRLAFSLYQGSGADLSETVYLTSVTYNYSMVGNKYTFYNGGVLNYMNDERIALNTYSIHTANVLYENMNIFFDTLK